MYKNQSLIKKLDGKLYCSFCSNDDTIKEDDISNVTPLGQKFVVTCKQQECIDKYEKRFNQKIHV